MAGVGNQDELYREAADEYGAALARLALAYEADPELRRDLLQEIHLALWRSCAKFNGRCSLRTWVYRVAHNVAATHVIRESRKRNAAGLVSLEEAEAQAGDEDVEASMERQQFLSRALTLIQRLELIDRQVILAYLEDLDAESISEITGLSPANVWTKIHRIKNLLAARFRTGAGDAK